MGKKVSNESGFFADFTVGDLLYFLSLAISIGIAVWSYNNVEVVKISLEETKVEVEQNKLANDDLRVELEKTKVSNDKANLLINNSKFLIDTSKFLNDIKPKIAMECSAELILRNRIKAVCSTTNKGSYGLNFASPSVNLRFINTNTYLDSKYVKQYSSEGIAVPQNLGGTVVVYFDVLADLDWSKFEVATTINAVTDRHIIQVAKDILKDKTDIDTIESVSQQSFIYFNPIKYQNINAQ